jgi:hypothetical protein
MKPYYEHGGIQIFHGDCREILPQLSAEAIITDPVWPNCEHIFPGVDAKRLLSEALAVANVERLFIQVGCFSDPRFLCAVPDKFEFVRVCWLEYACPSYRGRILNTGDIGYVFGEPPAPRKGAMILPGKVTARVTDKGFTRWNWDSGKNRKLNHSKERHGLSHAERMPHPTPRRSEHVRWSVKWFAGSSVIDPFAGSGMTLLQCKKLQIAATGIEIEEKYCEIAAKRMEQEVFAFEPEAGPVAKAEQIPLTTIPPIYSPSIACEAIDEETR